MPDARALGRLRSPRRRRIVVGVAVVSLLVLMGFGTKVVKNTPTTAAAKRGFSPAAYGASEFPKVQKAIEARAVDAKVLAAAIAADQAAAVKKYGVSSPIGPVLSVLFRGVAGAPGDGDCPVTIAGLPKGLNVLVQTGPAIIGTELRDATGTIDFSQFTDQIQYQNAGAALNTQMKKSVLSKVDVGQLKGKTVTVVGAFRLINPGRWLVTPVKLTVQ